MTWVVAVAQWAYQNVVGNLVASAIAFVAAWVWKIRPLHRKVERLHAHLVPQEEVGDGR